MEQRLTKKNLAKLRQLILKVAEEGRKPHEPPAESYYRPGGWIILGEVGRRHLDEAVKTIQTVPQWDEAYPADVIRERIINAIFQGGELEEVVSRITDALRADCKQIRAYVAFSGFHLKPDAEIKIGKHVLRVLGQSGVENEIIGRLNEHMQDRNMSEEDREAERERTRKYIAKHANLPILVVEFFGSVEGAKQFIEPIAEYVALFMQFCIGALTDRFFDEPVIVDYRGRFRGDFSAYMPVMTVEYDQLSFPNLRGFPYDCEITKDDVARLEGMGVLELADEFLNPPSKTPNAIRNLLVRAMCAFADGERAVSKLSRITAYVTATEVFFSQKERTTTWVTTGVAAANSSNETEYEQNLHWAKAVYDERSSAVHEGFEPRLTFTARKLALGAILRMIKMQKELATRKKIQKWLAPRIPDVKKLKPWLFIAPAFRTFLRFVLRDR